MVTSTCTSGSECSVSTATRVPAAVAPDVGAGAFQVAAGAIAGRFASSGFTAHALDASARIKPATNGWPCAVSGRRFTWHLRSARRRW